MANGTAVTIWSHRNATMEHLAAVLQACQFRSLTLIELPGPPLVEA